MRALKFVMYLVGLGVAALYLLNPTAGVFELLPDNLPFIGNLDEVAAMGLFVACWRGLKGLRTEGKAGSTAVQPVNPPRSQ